MRKTLLFCIVWMLFSCQPTPSNTTPDYVLSEDKMVSVMVDMHLVETAANLKVFPPDSAQQMYSDRFASIFLTHQTTQAKYDSSLWYYATQTDRMNVIYDLVLEQLSELESEVKSDQ